MKALLEGKDLAETLRQLHKDVPKADRLIFSANGHLDVTAFNSASFQGKTVEMPCDTWDEGQTAIKSFDMIYKLSQDSEIKAGKLTLEVQDDRLSLTTVFECRVKKPQSRPFPYSFDVPAEYRFETVDYTGLNIAAVIEEEPEPEAPAPIHTPSPDLLKSVTVPSVMVKGYLPRTRDTSVVIASTSKAVLMLVQNGDSSAAHILAAATSERFSLSIPVKVLRAAIKASDTLTIGIRGRAFEWQGLKDTHGHPDRKYISKGEPLARECFHFVETTLGEVNGVPVLNKKQSYSDYRHDRVAGTCIPSRHVIAYRDTTDTPAYRKYGFDSSERLPVYGPWHYVRLLNTPPAIANQIALRMSEKAGRKLESVYTYEGEEIILESEIHPGPTWEVLRVDRKHGEYSYNRDEWNVFVTFKTAKDHRRGSKDTCRVGIARGLTDEQSKLLTKRPDIAAQLLNGTLTVYALPELLAKEAAPKMKVVETIFGEVTVRTVPVRQEPVRQTEHREKVIIQEPITMEMFEI
jgi:hypothetical protein